MLNECKGISNWLDCINCNLLSTRLCPLEGEDSIDKIVNRIKMLEDPGYRGFKERVLK